MAKIKANADQSRILATLRDALLPKLLSGELSSVADVLKRARHTQQNFFWHSAVATAAHSRAAHANSLLMRLLVDIP